MALDIGRLLGLGSSKVDISQPFMGAIGFSEDFEGSITSQMSATADAEKYRLAGVGTNVLSATEDVDGGGMTCQTGATDNNEFGLQLNGSAFFCRPATGIAPVRQLRTGFRMSISSVSASSFVFGMYLKDTFTTTGPTSGLTGTQPGGIGLAVINGVLQYQTKGTSTTALTTITGAPAIAAGVLNNYEIQMDSQGVFSFWLNGTKWLSVSGAVTPVSTTVGLSPAFAVKTTGGSAAKSINAQRWWAFVEPPTTGW